MKEFFITLYRKLPANHRQLLSVYAIFTGFVLLNWYFEPGMFGLVRFNTLALQFAPLILLTMAQSITMLIGGTNLSIGPGMAMLTCIAAVTMGQSIPGILLCLLLVIVCGIVMGGCLGAVISYGRLSPYITSLAFQFIWRGIAMYILPIPGGHVSPLFLSFMTNPSYLSKGVLIVVLGAVLWKIFKNTKMGVAIYAVGSNERAAFTCGYQPQFIKVVAYMFSGFFIALSAIAMVAVAGSGDYSIGNVLTLNAVASAVIGGVSFSGGEGQIKGAIMGAIVFSMLLNILFFSGISPFYQYIVRGMVLILSIGLKALSSYRKAGA